MHSLLAKASFSLYQALIAKPLPRQLRPACSSECCTNVGGYSMCSWRAVTVSRQFRASLGTQLFSRKTSRIAAGNLVFLLPLRLLRFPGSIRSKWCQKSVMSHFAPLTCHLGAEQKEERFVGGRDILLYRTEQPSNTEVQGQPFESNLTAICKRPISRNPPYSLGISFGIV